VGVIQGKPLAWLAIVRRLSQGCALALMLGAHAYAGNQKEEALADSVRIALSRAISDARPPRPQFANIDERIKYLHWLGEMSDRLKRKLPDRQVRREFLETAWYESKRAGLDPAMVLGLIQVESAFRKYAVSHVGAHGYMQVMPFWARVIGDGDRTKLFHMQTNLRYGCSILRMYIDMERGNLYLALGRYNGSRGRPEYPNAVLAAWKNWEHKT
jgi:soluble lytic murein transglycosylase-like protein